MADRGHVEQILMNLAVNAQDAMPQGGTLTIATGHTELEPAAGSLAASPVPCVVLTVSDTGVGMTPEVLAHIFEPFFTTKAPGRGTGLGLATVHGIAVSSGGCVRVQSTVGAGTAFRVYLPSLITEDDVVDEARVPDTFYRSGTETVLVVDDADGVRELATRLLERQGYTVLAAATAEEARQVFAQHSSIAVLLTDVVMPGTSGPDLAQQLLTERPDLRVIYMSGYAQDMIAAPGVLPPGIALLQKPFSADTLGQKIRAILDM